MRVVFDTTRLPECFSGLAQDGSRYDSLLGTSHVHLNDCSLAPQQTTRAVRHQAHDEIWFVRSGEGSVWRRRDDHEEVVSVEAGACMTIPAGTAFQFQNTGAGPFRFLIVQAPPWPDETVEPAFAFVEGPWKPTNVPDWPG